MLHVLFVAPTFSPNTLRVLGALAALDGVRTGVISADPAERLPAGLRQRTAGHFQVRDPLDADQLVAAGRAFQRDWGRVDRLLGFLEQLQVPLGVARDRLGLPGMGESVARNFREKNRMKEVLRAAGLPVAPQALVGSADDLRRFTDAVGFPVVVKPPAGLGSRSTVRVRSADEIAAAIQALGVSAARPAQAEAFITGDEHTFEAVSIDGAPVWASSSRYLPGPLEVLENPWMQYCVLLPREGLAGAPAAFQATNAAALRALGMDTGLSHMEWFLQKDGRPIISEVGARPPGVNLMPMMGYAHGVDFWARWAELVTFGRWSVPERQYAVGCAFFRGQGEGRRVVALEGLDAAQERAGAWVIDRKLPVVGMPRADGYEGEGWAIVRAPDTATVKQALLDLVRSVRVVMG